MKILLVNKFYYPRGGDCIYTLELEKLLKAKGHEVAVFSMQHPENMASDYSTYFPSETIFSLSNKKGLKETLLRPFGTQEVKRKFNALIDAFEPNIVHLNNIHTQLSPVVAKMAHERGIRVVWTLHDYKLLCPRYDCLRNDVQTCERCFTDKIHVLKNNCMKNNLLASVIAYGEAVKWNKEKLQKYTSCFICPSQFIHDKMLQGGFNKNKLKWLCNSIDTIKTKRDNYLKDNYYCYLGRLSHEKGITTLIKAAEQLPYTLKIIGGGPLNDYLKKELITTNIEFLGYKNWEEIKDLVGKARFMVIPSEWYENNPLSVIEAKCLGTPVLGANIGGIPELIDEEINGLMFNSKDVDDLRNKIELMFNMSFNYEKIANDSQIKYSQENYYKNLINIYNLN